MKHDICKAFCDSVKVSELAGGFGISSTLFSVNGDPAGIYVTGPSENNKWRLDDGGWLLPIVISSGFDISSNNRARSLNEILASTGLQLDEDDLEIFIENIDAEAVPSASVQFLASLSRIADLGAWNQERIKSTFREDVKERLETLLSDDILIEEESAPDPRASDLKADLVLRPASGRPVALYLAQTDVPLLEAMLLRSETSELQERPIVTAIMERENSATKKTRTRAHNRLDVVTIYDGDQQAAIARVAQELAPYN